MDDEIPLQEDSHASSSHEASLDPTLTRSVGLGKHSADHKVLSDKMRISKQSPICSRGARLGHPMDPVVSVQNQNFTRNPEKLAKVPGTQKSFTLTIPWNSAKLVKISPGIIARRHHTDRGLMGLPKEQCAE